MSPIDNRWDSRYAGEDYLFGEAPNAFLLSQAPRLQPGWRALAVADGEGRNGVWLAEQGLDVLSVDASAVAQDKARKLAERRGVSLELEQADLEAWPWPEGEFELVAAIFIQFADPPLRAQIFEGMQKALKPGGLLLLQGYRPEQLQYATGGPSSIGNFYTEGMLRDAFAALDLVELRAHDSVISEGTGHNGMSALINLVARKPPLPHS